MSFQWVQVNPDRLEYRKSEDHLICVAEVAKRCGYYFEAVVLKRSSRMLLHRGNSESAAIEAVVGYFRNTTASESTRSL